MPDIDETQLKIAVKDTTIKDKFSGRRFFKRLTGTPDTTRVVSEFQNKVTETKGW